MLTYFRFKYSPMEIRGYFIATTHQKIPVSTHFNTHSSFHFSTESHPSQLLIPRPFQPQNMSNLPHTSVAKHTYCSPISSPQTHPFLPPNAAIATPISAPNSTPISVTKLAHLSPHFGPQRHPFLPYFITQTHPFQPPTAHT